MWSLKTAPKIRLPKSTSVIRLFAARCTAISSLAISLSSDLDRLGQLIAQWPVLFVAKRVDRVEVGSLNGRYSPKNSPTLMEARTPWKNVVRYKGLLPTTTFHGRTSHRFTRPFVT